MMSSGVPDEATNVHVPALRAGDIIGRRTRPRERLIFLGASGPAPGPDGAELYVLSVGFDDGTGFALPVAAADALLRYPGGPAVRA